MPTILSSSEPVARKPYICEWCGEEIEQGMKHASWAYPEDGRMLRVRAHLGCNRVWSQMSHEDYGLIEGHRCDPREPDVEEKQ